MRNYLLFLLTLALPQPAVAAGNVTVELSAEGDLVITGDAADNEIRISQTAPGEFFVKGVLTDLNGAPNDVTVTGVTKDIKVKLKGGDDSLHLERVDVNGNVKIDHGDGDGFTRLFDSDVAGDFTVKAMGGNDEFRNTSARIGGNMKIDFGDGDNDIGLDLFARGNLTIKVKGGEDFIQLSDGSGADGKVTIDAGSGENVIHLFGQTKAGILEVKAKGGADIFEIKRCASVHGNASIDLGNGDNTLVVEGLEVYGTLGIKTGTGSDELTLKPLFPICNSTVFGDTKVKLGAGDDTLTIEDLEFKGKLGIDASPGDDTLKLG